MLIMVLNTLFIIQIRRLFTSACIGLDGYYYKKAVLPQGNRAMRQVFFPVEVRQQHSLQV